MLFTALSGVGFSCCEESLMWHRLAAAAGHQVSIIQRKRSRHLPPLLDVTTEYLNGSSALNGNKAIQQGCVNQAHTWELTGGFQEANFPFVDFFSICSIFLRASLLIEESVLPMEYD